MGKQFSICKLSVYSYCIRLKASVLIRGIRFSQKEGLLIKIENPEGNISWGEISSLPPTKEKITACIQEIENKYKDCLGEKDICEITDLFTHPEIKFAFVCALNFLEGSKLEDQSCSTININALLTGDVNNILKLAKEKKDSAYSVLKIKMGEFSLSAGKDLIQELRDIVGRDMELVLDLNRQWAFDDVMKFVEQTFDLDIAYIEDPVQDVNDLTSYLLFSPVKAGIDEYFEMGKSSYEKVWEISQTFEDKVVLIIKPSTIFGTEAWDRFVENSDNVRVFTSSWETGIGLRGVLDLARKHGDITRHVGLDTYSYLERDIAHPELPIPAPHISLNIINSPFIVHEEQLTKIASWQI